MAACSWRVGGVSRRVGTRSPRRCSPELARRGTRTLFAFSPGDPGIDPFERAIGPVAVAPSAPAPAALPDRFGAGLQVLAGLNHNVSAAPMRARQVVAMLIRFLAEDVRKRERTVHASLRETILEQMRQVAAEQAKTLVHRCPTR